MVLLKPNAFLTFSPSPDLKIPNVFKTCLTDQTFLEQTVFNDIGHPVSGEKPSLSILLKVAKKGLCHTTCSSFEAYEPNPNFWPDKICFLSHYTSFSRAHII